MGLKWPRRGLRRDFRSLGLVNGLGTRADVAVENCRVKMGPLFFMTRGKDIAQHGVTDHVRFTMSSTT